MEASYAQTSFLGGEISEWAQGQFDRPEYKISLAKASNILIVDEGAATRRPGFQFLGTTRNGAAGRLLPFDFAANSPYNLEFTDSFLRFWNGTSLVTSNEIVIKVTNATPAVFTLGTAVTWATGDEAYFTFLSPAQAVVGVALLKRQFVLTMLTTTTFTIVDAITGDAINGSDLTFSTQGALVGAIDTSAISSLPLSGSVAATFSVVNLAVTVNHIAQISTSYTQAGADWHSLRLVQGLELGMLLHGQVQPQALQVTALPSGNNFATFSFGAASFQDGPYLDPPAGAIATPSAVSGVITVTVSYPAYASGTVYGIGVRVTSSSVDYVSLVNNNSGHTPVSSPSQWAPLHLGSMISPLGFVATDVGRMIRLYSSPPLWVAGTTYSIGNNVTYNGSQFTSLVNTNTGNEPDISLSDWVLNTSAALWSWGTITAVNAANVVHVQIFGANLLYTTPCPLFRIGAWSDTTGWPTCGCYQGGRFWFAGAIPNRVDSSQSDNPFNLAPTLQDGTVTDACAISYTFNSNSLDQIYWMEPQAQGIMIGTQKGEYLLSSGTSGGPITPSSIAESPQTRYGSSNIVPARTGLTMCFVQRNSRRLLEYLADVFSLRFFGPDLTTYARHIGQRQFSEVAYQQEPVPVVWARMGDGSLAGTTYRRNTLFSNQKPEFNAWHQHPLGSGRTIESICVGPANDENYVTGQRDTLSLVTNDPGTGVRFVESMTTLMDETDPLYQSYFLDAAIAPGAAMLSNGAVTFYGLWHLDGYRASVFAAGIDCGDYLVIDGQVTIPLGTADPISGYTFDILQFKLLQPQMADFADHSVTIIDTDATYTIPCIIGFNYKSQGQLCRPMLPETTGARNGPGFGKKRRTARYGISLSQSIGVQVGTAFSDMLPVSTVSPTGKRMPYLSMFSGIKRETLKNDFSFDSMLCWQTTRPFPATVTAFGGFIVTEDV